MTPLLHSWTRQGRRTAAAATAAALLAAGLGALGAAPAGAANPACPEADYYDVISGAADFDRDELLDVTYGQPSRSVNDKREAGAVVVVQSCAGTITLTSANTGLGPAVAGGRFGSVVHPTQFDDDAYDDLIIGAPGQDGGALVVVYGSASGLNRGRAARIVTVPALHVGDRFGSNVTFGSDHAPVDPNNDSDNEPEPGPTTVRMVVGAPGTDLGSAKDAGVVHVLTVEKEPYRLVSSTRWIQGKGGLPGKAEKGDRFGGVVVGGASFHKDQDEFSLVSATLVGVPHEDVGKAKDAGTVYVVPALDTRHGRSLSQSTRGVPGVAHPNEHFGAAAVFAGWTTAGFFVGTPGDQVGKVKQAGSVQLVRADRPTDRSQAIKLSAKTPLNQNTRGVPDKAEKGDHLGSSLALVGNYGSPDLLAVGVPDENVGKAVDAGAVTTFRRSGACGKKCTTRTQNSRGVAGVAEKGDHYGATLTAITDRTPDANDDSSAMVGVPGEDVGTRRDAGAISDSRRTTNRKVEFSPLHSGPVAGGRLGEVAPAVWG